MTRLLTKARQIMADGVHGRSFKSVLLSYLLVWAATVPPTLIILMACGEIIAYGFLLVAVLALVVLARYFF